MSGHFWIAIVVIGVLPLRGMGQAVSRTFVGTDGSSWSDPNNWSPVGVPVASSEDEGDDATIASPLTVLFDYDYQSGFLDNFVVGPNAGYIQTGGRLAAASVTLHGTGNLTGGRIDSQGYISIDGTYNISGDAVIRGFPGDIGISGTISQSGGTIESADDVGIGYVVYYLSSNGRLSGDGLEFGPGSTVIQTGGSAEGTEVLSISGTTKDPTIYHLEGGTLEGYLGFIQIGGTVDFYQSGGALATVEGLYNINIGEAAGDDVTYKLSGGSIDSTEHLTFGINSTVNQSGGYASGDYSVDIRGSYLLSGGTIGSNEAETISGDLDQTNGTNDADLGIPVGLSITTTGRYELAGGTLVTRPFSNSGIFSIDAKSMKSGQISAWTFDQTSTGTLDFTDLVPSNIAILAPTQSVALGGDLKITFDPSYVPAIGDVFVLLQSPELTGTFADYDLPSLDNGLYFQPIYTRTEMKLVIVPEPAGLRLLLAASLLVPRRRRAVR